MKEQEDEIKRYEKQLKDLNEDIDCYNSKRIRYNKQLTQLEEEGNTLDVSSKGKMLPMIHCDMAGRLTDKCTKNQMYSRLQKSH